MKPENQHIKSTKKRVIMAVTNDLTTDQRIRRHCITLQEHGYNVLLTGRLLKDCADPGSAPCNMRRVRHLFNKGPLFYAEYNIRLFFYLLAKKVDIIHANDLDTLPATFLAARLRGKQLVYDSHEFFTAVPELTDRPSIRKTWEFIERIIFPKLESIITVNNSIASLYRKKYGKEVTVIRNLPVKWVAGKTNRDKFGLAGDKKLIILQGAGINIDRGAEEAAEAMEHVEDAILVIAGKGDIIPQLKHRIAGTALEHKVIFFPPMPRERLIELTSLCDCGLSLDKDTNLNYRFSLPNKLFDYIMAGTPVIASPLPEVRKIVEHYRVGLIADEISPEGIAEKINKMLKMNGKEAFAENLEKAAGELNWEAEQHILVSLYSRLGETRKT